MSEPAPTQTRPRRRWLRRLWLTLALLVGLGVIAVLALQPVAFWYLRRTAEKLGLDRKIKIEYEIDGSIWTHVRVRTLRLTPTGPGSEIIGASVGSADVHYDLWKLFRGGLRSGFLSEIVLRDVRVEIDPAAAVKKAVEEAPYIGLPSIILPDRIELQNVSFISRGGAQFEGVNLTLDPQHDGELRIASAVIPGLQPLADVRAATSFLKRVLELRDLRVTDSLRIDRLSINSGQATAGEWLVELSAHVLDGRVEGSAKVDRADTPKPQFRVQVNGADVSLRWPEDLLTQPPPALLAGRISRLTWSLAPDPQNSDVALGSMNLSGSGIRVDGNAVDQLEFTSKLQRAASRGSWLTGLVSDSTLVLTQPRADKLAADEMRLETRSEAGRATVKRIEVRRGTNVFTAAGKFDFPELREVEGTFALDAPDLGQLSLEGEAPPLLGAMKGSGVARRVGERWSGEATLEGAALQARGVTIEKLDAGFRAADGVIWLERANVRFDAQNHLGLGGYVRAEGTRDFRLEISGEFPRLALFEPVLRANGVREKLDGSLSAQWLALGSAESPATLRKTLSGGGTITGRAIRWGANAPVEFDLSGSQAGATLDFPTVAIRAGELELKTTFHLENGLAALESLSLRRKGDVLLTGLVRVPLDVESARFLPADERLYSDLATTKPLPLAELWQAAGRADKPPLEGDLGLSFTARGSLAKPVIDLALQGRGWKRSSLVKIKPGDFDLAFSLRDGKARLDGTVKQPQIRPLVVKAEIPLDLPQFLETRHLPPNTPLRGEMHLPPSDLKNLIGIVPGLRFIEGSASLDLEIGGTVGNPRPLGHAQITIPAARAENLSFPALRDVKVRLDFTEREVTITQGQFEIAGGKLTASGKVEYSNRSNTVIDVAIKAKDVLVARDENLLVRTNADVKITGAFASALVSGTVGITKSRFFREIDIVPLPLPGDQKPPPVAPPPPRPRGVGMQVGVDLPPFRDWKLDLAIRTDDPIRVLGNVANGRITGELKLTGTAGTPLLEGPVLVEQLRAKLPFSRLDIDNGSIYFTPDQPFNPLLNLTGVSTIRDRVVTVNIFGRADDPKTLFSSDPPLPQEQIVTLLATGATLDDLRENRGALIGKATILAAQRVWGKISKRKKAPDDENSILGRFDFDLGNVDPKTGKQTVGARFRATDNVVVTSDLDQDGNFRGRVKYVFRFR